MGDLNARLEEQRNECEEDLVTKLTDHGLEYVCRHFTPRRRYRGRGRWKWQMKQDVRQVMGRRGIRPWHGAGRLHKCGDEGTQTSHRPHYDASRDPWRGGDVQQEVQMGKKKVDHLEKHTQAIFITKGRIKIPQGRSRQGATANDCVRGLNLGGNMEAGGQENITKESGTGKRHRGKDVKIPKNHYSIIA